MERNLPFVSIPALHGPPKSGDWDTLGSGICPDILLCNLLGRWTDNITAQNIPILGYTWMQSRKGPHFKCTAVTGLSATDVML